MNLVHQVESIVKQHQIPGGLENPYTTLTAHVSIRLITNQSINNVRNNVSIASNYQKLSLFAGRSASLVGVLNIGRQRLNKRNLTFA